MIKNKVLGYRFYGYSLWALLGAFLGFKSESSFYGWGRKRTGRFASWCATKSGGKVILLEDGFLRSVGLGVEGAPSFSRVKDDLGIYYDATVPSRLEVLLNTYDFEAQPALLALAKEAMRLVVAHKLSKYNHAPLVEPDIFFTAKAGFAPGSVKTAKVLVVAQTAGDAAIRFGYGELYSNQTMIDAAINENPGAQVYVKVHPDVLSGKKRSDIDLTMLNSRCVVLDEDVNPLSLIECFDAVYTKTSLMGFEALLLGKKVVCFGVPFYAGWGLTDDRVAMLKRRQRSLSLEQIFAAAYILYSEYRNPFNGQILTILEAIDALIYYRMAYQNSLEFDKAFFFGFSRWKHRLVKPFFDEIRPLQFCFINPWVRPSYLSQALKAGLTNQSRVYIWGRKAFPDIEAYARNHGVAVFRVEDGFVRSASLGSDLTQPFSLVVDRQGIYFDASQPSDLEVILNSYDFESEPRLLQRAQEATDYLVEKKLTKYNVYEHVVLSLPTDKTLILVPGQVEDDASIQFGANGMTNLSLLQATRQACPNGYIVYKPHPDVLAGNRMGHVSEHEALQYCNRVVTEVSVDSVLALVDEVHTMTSLVGFEALLRGKKVVTYGMPFYAGWGLTIDHKINKRRGRNLTLNALVAGVLLVYPRYLDPNSRTHCELEQVFTGLEQQMMRLKASAGLRVWQRLRNKVVRQALYFGRQFKKMQKM